MDEANARRRERYSARKGAGLCPKCGAPPEGGYVFCEACRGKARQARAARYKRMKARGRCPDCGRTAEPGKVYCEICAAERAIYQMRNPRDAAHKALVLEDCHKLYSARKAQGLCVRCGKPAYTHNGHAYVMCYEHYIGMRRQEARRQRERWAVRQATQLARHWHGVKPGPNHPWRRGWVNKQ